MVVVVASALWLTALPVAQADAPGAPAPTVLRTMAAVDANTLTADVVRGRSVRRSAPMKAPIAFSMLGFRAPSDTHLRVRTSVDGLTWQPWQELEEISEDEGPDPESEEPTVNSRGAVPTVPMWTGAARWLQFEATGLARGAVVPVVIDSLGQGRALPLRMWDALREAWAQSWQGRPARAAAGQPTIVSRAQWGADESLRSGQPTYSRRVRLGFVHHTVNANSYSQEEAPALLRGIYRYHTQSLGWKDLGYQFLVDRFGTIYEGRAGGIDRPVLGAQASGFNTSTFGVASIGTHNTVGPTPQAVESIAQVIAWKFDIHHIDVAGSVELESRGSTRFPDGHMVRLPTVSGHRAVSNTSCPGQSLDSLLPAIRHRVLELGGATILDHDAAPLRVTVAEGRVLDAPVQFSARLRPAGEWTLRVTEPGGRAVYETEGSGTQVAASWTPPFGTPRGRYTWTISSAGRTDASDYVDIVPPVIREARSTPNVVRGGKDSGFAPLRITATLWSGANWDLAISDPQGTVVQRASGIGAQFAYDWAGRSGLEPGRYTWRLLADDAAPELGSVEVLWPVLARAGVAADAIGGAVALSALTFAPGEARSAVLARADVFADAMVGGPLAGTQGPVLLTSSGSLDERVRAELQRVLPDGSTVYLLGGDAALSPAIASALATRWRVVRLSGAGRTQTAARVADEVFTRTGSRRALIARAGPDSAAPWADALAGGAYGAWAGVPVLLTDRDDLSPAAASALERHFVNEAIVLGGPSAISDQILNQLPAPRRIFGQDRAGTATAIAEQLWGRRAAGANDVVIAANGYANDGWVLALAASPLAARRMAPLLLLTRDELPASTRAYLDGLTYSAANAASGWMLGSESSIGAAAADELLRRLQ